MSLVPGWNSNLAPTMFTDFRAGGYGGGNLGIRYDAAGFTYPGAMQMGWMEFFNRQANLGLYYANHDIDMPTPALKYTFPEWTSTICAESPGDINVMNNGMRYGLVWAVQPRHYNDSMDEPLTRPLSRYVQELIRIRSKHQDVLFFGRFRDTLGAKSREGRWCGTPSLRAWTGPARHVWW